MASRIGLELLRKWALSLCCATASAAFPAAVSAQEAYPSRTITFVCAFSAGASMDTIVRFLADRIRPMAKQTIVVENRPGAQGAIATEYTLRAKPDGHTIFVNAATQIAANDSLLKSPPANTRTGLRIVATISRQAFVIAVDATTPYRSLGELTEALKPKGAKASYAAYTIAGTIVGALYREATGLQTVEVSYRSGAQTLNDMRSGVLDFGIYDPALAMTQERAGRLRILAIVSSERMQTTPDVPTLSELGIPVDLTGWFAAIVPAATPAPIAEEIGRWFNAAVAQEETRSFLLGAGSDPWSLPADEAQKAYLAAFDKYRQAVQAARIVPQ